MSKIFEGIYKSIENRPLDEDLRKWFKEKWVRFNPQGKIMGPCARGDDSEGKPKCLPQAKAHAIGKKGRKYAAAKKRREDPNPERSGPAKNVATKKKTNEDLSDTLYWNHLSDTITIQEKLTILEEYYSSNMIIKESNDIELADYFSKLSNLSETPVKNKKYLMIFLGLMNNKVLKLHAPEQVTVLSKEGNIYTLKFNDGRVTEFPEKTISNKLTTILLFFNNTAGYDKLRTILSLKFDFDGLEDLGPYFKNKTNEEHSCPHCGGILVSEELMNEKKDACYYKVKSRYKVWPSAYASGALVKCRKKGAKNWGTKSESAIMRGIQNEEK